MFRSCGVAVVVCSAMALASSAEAALLAVDFNGAAGPTETGFSGFSAVNGDLGVSTISQTFGAYTVSLSTSGGTLNLFSRDRATPADSGAFTYGELYRDWISGAGTTGAGNPPLTLSISGLSPATAYSITVYSCDSTIGTGNNGVGVDTPIIESFSDSTGVVGSISYWGAPSTNSQYALTIPSTLTSAGGMLTITGQVVESRNAQSRAIFNGFELNLVPEPATLSLLVGASGLMLLRRRGGQ